MSANSARNTTVLKYGEPNPLNVFGLRRLEHCPPHFTVIQFELKTNIKQITDWIHENLEGRFYAGDSYCEDSNSQRIQMIKCVGFENPSEASYFSLLLDKLNTWEP